MPNSFFSFKQFTVHQEYCAQKVSTDACLLGALVAERWKNRKEVLDIGAGTGLLMLMLAQKSNGYIQGIEIEKDCYEQLKQNILASPWKDRLSALYGDVVAHDFKQSFDGIISNPPFFENDLPSTDTKVRIARHSLLLTIKQLFGTVKKWLKEDGELALLVPANRVRDCIHDAREEGLHLASCTLFRHSAEHPYQRGVTIFQKQPYGPAVESSFTLMDEDQRYTPEAQQLLRDYYLYL